MSLKNIQIDQAFSCKLPRRKEAVNALFTLVWKKTRPSRPNWIIEELENYS